MDVFKSIMTGLKEVADHVGNKEVSADIQNKLDNWDEYVSSIDNGINESAFNDEEETICERYDVMFLYYPLTTNEVNRIKKDGKISCNGGIKLYESKEDVILSNNSDEDIRVISINPDYMNVNSISKLNNCFIYCEDIPIEAVYSFV